MLQPENVFFPKNITKTHLAPIPPNTKRTDPAPPPPTRTPIQCLSHDAGLSAGTSYRLDCQRKRATPLSHAWQLKKQNTDQKPRPPPTHPPPPPQIPIKRRTRPPWCRRRSPGDSACLLLPGRTSERSCRYSSAPAQYNQRSRRAPCPLRWRLPLVHRCLP